MASFKRSIVGAGVEAGIEGAIARWLFSLWRDD